MPGVVWLTGLPGSGKTTLADALQLRLGSMAYVLDGDRLRTGLNRDLGFGEDDRQENVRRIAEVARLFAKAGTLAIVAAVSPMRSDRLAARRIAGDVPFIEVHVHAPLAVCEARDPKGFYRQARAGLLPGFTGIDAPYEEPLDPDLRLETGVNTSDDAVTRLLALVRERGLVPHP